MKTIKQKYGLLILGVLIGAAYGIITRVVFGERATLASITYLFLNPAILGIVPLVFANDDQIRSYRNIIFIPWITIATFFLTTVLVGMEEFICLLVLAGPFFILGTIGALIVRLIMIRRQKNKMLALMFLPFIFSPVEEEFKSPSEIYRVESEVLISASRAAVWDNIVEVRAIRKEEYSPGVFNWLGIPRPLSATVSGKEKGATRIGNFDGGLRFVETLSDYEPASRVSFSIVVDPASVGPRVFDQHVLNGNYFTFVEASYELMETDGGQIRLKLTSSYQLTSKVNFYGKFWGDMILKDFQDRLLNVIEKRCEAPGEH